MKILKKMYKLSKNNFLPHWFMFWVYFLLKNSRGKYKNKSGGLVTNKNI
jgi:hypothetical protein